MTDGRLIAVLTGDIVGSSGLAAADLSTLLDRIASAVGDFDTVRPGCMIGAADVFRGDSWQIAMADPGPALRFAVYLRAIAISSRLADTRISIGFGTADSLREDAISLSTGPAFETSGAGLDGMKSHRLGMFFAEHDIGASNAGKAIAALMDVVVGGWSADQAGAMRRVLENPGKSDAAVLGEPAGDSERRNFTKLRNRAHADAVLTALGEWESMPLWSNDSARFGLPESSC